MPVLENVPASLRPIAPDLPIPVTTSLPLQLRISSTASANESSEPVAELQYRLAFAFERGYRASDCVLSIFIRKILLAHTTSAAIIAQRMRNVEWTKSLPHSAFPCLSTFYPRAGRVYK